MAQYGGMTVNERLFAAGLLHVFQRTGEARDREGMIAILKQVEFTEQEAESITESILENPKKYGF